MNKYKTLEEFLLRKIIETECTFMIYSKGELK